MCNWITLFYPLKKTNVIEIKSEIIATYIKA